MGQPTNTYELELTNLQRSIEAYESDLINLQQLTNMHEPEPNVELVDTSEHEPTMGGGRYPLRKRREPS